MLEYKEGLCFIKIKWPQEVMNCWSLGVFKQTRGSIDENIIDEIHVLFE